MQKPSSGSSYSTLRSGTSSVRYVLIKSSSPTTSRTRAHTFLRPSTPGSCLRIVLHSAENCSRSRFIKPSSGPVSDVVELGAARRSDHRQHLAPAQRVVTKRPKHAARHHRNPRFMYAAGRHTLVCRLDHHGDPLGLKHLVKSVGDLRRHLLLDLQAFGVDVDKPRKLRDADDPFVGQIGDMHLAD